MDDRLAMNERMERAQWDPFWVPPDTQVVDRDEILYLRCPRPLFYLNQVMRTRAAPARLPALLDEVREAHAHTISSWSVFDTFDRAPLERLLDKAGYVVGEASDAMVAPVDDVRPGLGSNDLRVVRVADHEGMRHSVQVMESTFGMSVEHPDAEIEELLAGCAGPEARIARFVVYDGDQPISTGAMNLYPDLDLAYLWGGSTVPEARGRGAYLASLAARVAFARACGIGSVGVYAIVDTSAPILARRGFVRCGYMNKWRRPAPEPAGEVTADDR